MLIGRVNIYFLFSSAFLSLEILGEHAHITNAEGVHGRRKFGNTCPKPEPRRQTINENVGCFE